MQKDPHDHKKRLKAYAKDPNDEDFFYELNRILEKAGLPRGSYYDKPEEIPFIYIVGPPRSGTTLLSQLIARCLPVGYINNLIARFWLKPSIGIQLSNIFFNEEIRSCLPLKSTHGTTSSIFSPHEFGYFWRKWLALDDAPTHHLSKNHLEKLDARGLKNALEKEILSVFSKPVATKNVICGFHAEFLTNIHPVSIFVYIERDKYATAASILKVRKERYGDYETWFSLKPSTYPFQNCINSADEIVYQVIDCQNEFKEELSKNTVNAVFTTYEELTTKPKEVLNRVANSIKTFQWPIEIMEENIPVLKPAKTTSLPKAIESDLVSAFNKLDS